MARHHRYRAPGIVYLLSFAAFAVATTVAVLVARGYTIDVTSGAIYKTGLLIVRSLPTNAYITVNNRLRKEHTPARLQFRPGTYRVKIDKPNVQPFQRTFTIRAEQANFAENILLWRNSPDVRTIASGATAQTISANRAQIAYLHSVPAGTELYVTSPDNQPALIATLPAAYAQPTTLTFNADATTVLVSTTTSSVIVPVGGNPQTIALGGETAFLPGSRDTILNRQGSQLLVAGAGETPTRLIDGVAAWTTTAQATYISSVDGATTRLENRGTSRKLLGRTAPLQELRAVAQSDQVLGRDASGTLYFFDPKADTPTTLASDVDEFAATPDGSFVALRSGQELRLWSRAQNGNVLVSRFATPFTVLQPTTGGHYLMFMRDGQLHAIAADGSNDVALLAVSESPQFLGDDRFLKLQAGALQLIRILDR